MPSVPVLTERQAFRFYDVIAALSLGTAPHSSTQPTTPYTLPPSLPVFSDSVPNSPLNSVDTLLGLSTDLWPIIHRLSHLLSNKRSLEAAIAASQTSKATVLRTELETTSQAIENALLSWRPSFTPADAEPEKLEAQSTRIQSIYHNAEAYRHSALVYLYRTIRSQPRSHSIVQKHMHLALHACSNVVLHAEKCKDGPMSALLWPLFVAACEAVSEGDRELAMSAFCGTERRQGMANIRRAWEVVQEVWRRADAGDWDANWRGICEERGFSIVFG